MQKKSAQKLCDIAQEYFTTNSKILDLGSGTSFIAKNILEHNIDCNIFEIDLSADMLADWKKRPKNIFPVIADIENLPFKNSANFDVIISSFTLQWVQNLEQLFLNLSQFLKKDGILAICLPVAPTLDEVKNSAQESDCLISLNKFPLEEKILEILRKNNFEKISHHIDERNVEYSSATSCLKEIKDVGANYSVTKNFIPKNKLQKFNELFLQRFNNESTWHLCYLIYKKNGNFQ